jgi:quercetin dioxygenase-like cupin family protein
VIDSKSKRVGEPGQRLRAPDGLEMLLVMTPSASGGKRLEMEWLVPAGAALVAADHYHPDGPEVWQIFDGRAGYRLDGEEHTVEAPHEYVVPASTSHGHPWNAGDEPMRARQIIDTGDEPMPELIGGVQGFFETSFAFAQAGEMNDEGEIGGRLQNLLSIHDLLVPGSFLAGPPKAVQRVGLGAVAALARATGKNAYREPKFS